MKVVEAISIKDYGSFRIVYDEQYGEYPYYVESCPYLLEENPNEDDWNIIGGYPGCNDSSFRTEKEAFAYYAECLFKQKDNPEIWTEKLEYAL